MIDPAHIAHNEVPPPVHIEKVLADRKPYAPRDKLVLPALMLDLEIDYAALSFVDPQRVQSRYKLEGRDTQWQDAGSRRQAFYTDLRPGPYRFRVIACNNDGVWNEVGDSFTFRIAPAWYQTNVFRISYVLSVLLLLWLFYYLRMKQAANAVRAMFDERAAERTRLARDLHDTLLQTLQGSKLVVDQAIENRSDAEYMRLSLQRLSKWIDLAMREGRAALNSLHTTAADPRDLSERLQAALDERELHGVKEGALTVIGTPIEMEPSILDEISRIGYEAIHNALMHSNASRIEVQLMYSRDFILTVRDNGQPALNPDHAHYTQRHNVVF